MVDDDTPPPSRGTDVPSLIPLDQLERMLLGGDARYTPDQLVEQVGAKRDETRRLWRAMGLADLPDDEATLTPADLSALERTLGMIGDDRLAFGEAVFLARILGQSTARIADSIIGFVAQRLADQGGSGPQAETTLQALPELLPDLDRVLIYLFHRHLLDSAVRRMSGVRSGEGGITTAVGFADLVGFTSLSQQLEDRDIAGLVEAFESMANNEVVGAGGHVVKMIGDEVMFSAPVDVAAEVALRLADSFDSPDLPAVRVGLACGRVLARAGDLFGPAVNMASRITAMAHPGSVLVSPELCDAYGHDARYSIKRTRHRRLKGIGTVELGVLRRAPEERPRR